VPLDPPVAPRHISFGWHRGRRSPAALPAFVEAAVAVCAEVEANQRAALSSRLATIR
jgi:hypothetical protein